MSDVETYTEWAWRMPDGFVVGPGRTRPNYWIGKEDGAPPNFAGALVTLVRRTVRVERTEWEEVNMTESTQTRCPYPGCTFEGTEDEVDEHRTCAHRDEPQAGSNQ